MLSLDDQITRLQSAIEAQEALRPTLGDAVVDVTLGALNAQLTALRAQQQAPRLPHVGLRPDQVLTHLQTYIPKELAEKMLATGRIEGERKQVTVLFADISGFTAFSERLDPEEVATLTNEVFKELAEVVYQYEGYIDKLVGDAVMAVFGAPVAHEDDPERALRAALAMRERLEQFNRRARERLGQTLTLHIGINTGVVIAGNVGSDLRLSYTVMGDTVNTASRLQDAAEPGQILVSRDTYRLTQAAFTFLALDPLTVKGKRKPLTVFQLQRARLHPGKSRGLMELASAFVGREHDLAQLRGVARELEVGRGHIVTISGEAGIGKSRLLAEWRVEAGERVRWIEGRSFAYTTALAYGPFLDLVRRYAGILDDDAEIQARARLDAAIDRFFPGNAEAHALFANLLAMRLSADEAALLTPLPADALRQRLFALVEELFTHLVQERPACLVLEDMHWADRASVELVEHLLPLTERLPLAIVGIFRPEPQGPPGALLAAIKARYAHRTTHIALEPLSETSSLQMVGRLLGTPDLPATLQTVIRSKAEGNPFFVEEVLRALIERGALVRSETSAGWVATPVIESVTVPDTLQGLLMARLDRLPNETKWVAQQAAVIGHTFLYRVLLQIAEHTPGLDADLSHLEREELIRERARDPEVEYIFKHALTQEVAYRSLLAPRRKELHRKVGAVMEALFAERLGEFHSIVAEHFFRGEAWDKAADYFIRAGDAATRLYAHAEARVHYGKALESLVHLPDTVENRRRRVDTTIKQVSVSLSADSPERNLARLAEVEPLAQALPSPDGAPGGDRLRLARVHFWIGRAHHYRNELREAISYYQQVLVVAREFDDEELLAIPSNVLGRGVGVQGHFGKSATLLAPAIVAFEKTANWAEWVWATGFLGLSLAARGQYAAGLVAGERARTRALETNYPTAIAASYILLAGIYLLGGDIPRMLDAGRAALQVAGQAGDQLYVYLGYNIQAWAESRLGQHQAAIESMAQSQAIGQSLGARLLLADWFAAARAEIALNAGHIEDALARAEEAVAIAQAAGGIFAEGLAQRVWGQSLAALYPVRWDEAEVHLGRSVSLLELGECHVEVARTHVAWGLLCRDRDDAAAALDHLQQAAVQFEAAGLSAELERTRDAMAGAQEHKE